MKPVKVVYLYPDDMNFYGDSGNVLTIMQRLKWRGINAELHLHHIGDTLPADADIVLGGGGQDHSQMLIAEHLVTQAERLRQWADDGVPMLMICGLYQLFGHKFVTSTGQTMPGIGIFDVETNGGKERMIGNITLETEFGELVGYENHSGLTLLSDSQQPFGRVVRGHGNTVNGGAEGARTNNVIGTYMHGPVLPKNPALADGLIELALQHAGLPALNEWPTIDDSLALQAHHFAGLRPQ